MTSKLDQTKDNLLAVRVAIEHARHLTSEAQATFKYSGILDDNFEDYVELYRALSRADSERLIEND